MASKSRRLIGHGIPQDFHVGFYNGFFKFMGKTRSVVIVNGQYLDDLLWNIKYTHPY